MGTPRMTGSAIGGWQVLSASGALDYSVSGELRLALERLVSRGDAVVVDLSGVDLLDCACVDVLVDTARTLAGRGSALRLVGTRGRVGRVLKITGAAAEFELAEDLVPGSASTPGEEVDRDAAVDTAEAALAARALLPPSDPRHRLLRDQAVRLLVPMARRLAGHYRRSRQPREELAQVAVLGMIKAIDRYDPGRGVPLRGFAAPTVLGELRRHFRDHTWGVHVPRHLQELRLTMNRQVESLTQRLERGPTTWELADELHASAADVREAVLAGQGYQAMSLSTPARPGGSTEFGDLIGAPDGKLELVDNYESVRVLLARLPDAERQVLAYRFLDDLTQTQVAGKLGISQMQVSRLQARALGRLRRGLLGEG